jgi:ribosomal protein L28
MIPEKLIIRRNETPGSLQVGEIYYVYFSEDTIRKIQQKYMMDKLLDKANIEHGRRFLPNVNVVESWIVEDPEKDKQQIYQMNYPKGTWMIIMKVEDDKAWSLVKEGKLKGYSVQGYFLEQAKFSSEDTHLIDEIKNILNKVK